MTSTTIANPLQQRGFRTRVERVMKIRKTSQEHLNDLKSLPTQSSMEGIVPGRNNRQMVRQTTYEAFTNLNEGEIDIYVATKVDVVVRDKCGPGGDRAGDGLTALEIAAVLKKHHDFSDNWKIRKRPNCKSEDRCLYTEVRRVLESGCEGEGAKFMKLSGDDGRYTLSMAVCRQMAK